jgi:glutamate--cysteine ligase
MRDGYQATVFGRRAADLCDALIGIARAGLNENERPFLEPLASLVSQRTTLADLA